jgi:hypothetical protein
MNIDNKIIKKPSVFDVLDGMITDTIQHSKIKSLMKNIATEDAVRELGRSDGDASRDEIPQKTAELADLDVAGAGAGAVSQKEKDKEKR